MTCIMAFHIFVSYETVAVAEMLRSVNKDVSRGCLTTKVWQSLAFNVKSLY